MAFQEFEPHFDWVHHPDSHVLVIHLPGFRTNELKVQVTSTGKLRIGGERKPNTGKWLRFQREFEVPADADTDKISAKFEDGVLYIRQAKKITVPNWQEHQAKPKEEIKTAEKPPVGPQPVRENASKNSHEKPKAPANAKGTNAPRLPQEPAKSKEEIKAPTTQTQKTAEKSSVRAQPASIPEVAPKNNVNKQTDGRSRPQSDSESSSSSEEKEPSGLKKEEKKDGVEEGKKGNEKEMEKGKEKEMEKGKEKEMEKRKEKEMEMEKEKEKGKQEGVERRDEDGGFDRVAEEDQRKRNKEAVKHHNGGGIIRQGEVYKQAVDTLVKELRTKMVSLVFSVLIFVIFYLTVTKKANVDGDGEL